MPDCNYYMSIISELVDGEASPQQAEQLHAHMEICPECRRVYSAFRGISDAMPEGLVEPPAKLAAGIMFIINAQKEIGKTPAPQKIQKLHILRYLSAAACLVLAIFGAARFGLLDNLLFPSSGNADNYALRAGADSAESAENDAAAPFQENQLIIYDDYVQEESALDEGSGSVTENQPMKFTELTGLLNSNFASNSLFVESEMAQLQEAAAISLYEGKFVPGSSEYAGRAPLADALDKKSRETLFELMTADALMELSDVSAENLDIFCTIVFTGVKVQNSSETRDLIVTVWIYDDILYFRLSSEPPIIYRSDTFPIDFQEFFDGLVNAKR